MAAREGLLFASDVGCMKIFLYGGGALDDFEYSGSIVLSFHL